MRILPVSLTQVLVELSDLDETLALFASLEADPVDGIEELLPAARTLMIRYRPDRVGASDLAGAIVGRDLSARTAKAERIVEIPVRYDGEDLAEVAALTSLSIDEVIARHTGSAYGVAFCGFAPGFAYLVGGDTALHVPRRQSPRTRIPAGSVALAGIFSGIYPKASPGGWQIIGTTPLRMWDRAREPSALLQPGVRVRFRDIATIGWVPDVATEAPASAVPVSRAVEGPRFEVLAAPIPAYFQDRGRFGQTGQGISASGALDQSAFAAANRVVGNPGNTPCLEITGGGFSFRSTARAVIGFTGATPGAVVVDKEGRARSFRAYEPTPLEEGDVVTLERPPAGARSYLAVRNGFAVTLFLGSAATDTLAVEGPEPVASGTSLELNGDPAGLASVSCHEAPAFAVPAPGEVVTLDIVLGPRTDWFTEGGLTTLVDQLWTVTPQSNRVGMRLAGDDPVERRDKVELQSEGTAKGAIQISHTGQPVLFLSDHPLTGGYPVIGAVAEHHLDLAGQVPVNARIRFRPLAPFAAITPTA